MCVVAMATLQGVGADRATSIVSRTKVRANPVDLGIDRETFVRAVTNLPAYVRRENLDFTIVDVVSVEPGTTERLWEAVAALPREQS